MNRPLAFFRVGTKAVCIQEISHWWVAPGAVDGPALCISMRNGKQVTFEKSNEDGDGYAFEKGLIEFIEQVGCL